MQIITSTKRYVDAHGRQPEGEGEWTFDIEYLTRGWREQHESVTYAADYATAKERALAHVGVHGPSNARSGHLHLRP